MDKEHEYRLRDLERQVKDFNKSVKSELEKIELRKVDKLEFKPVQTIVFGFVAMSLLAIFGAILSQVIK